MLYIIGVNHGIQYPLNSNRSDYSDEKLKLFLEKIKTQLSKIKTVSFIAEEMSEDGMKKRYIDSTLLKDFVNNPKVNLTNLQHIFIDPSIEEREKLGMLTLDKTPFRERENFWISKIQPELDNNKNGLVIIGLDHIETFQTLLRSKNILYEILIPNIDFQICDF